MSKETCSLKAITEPTLKVITFHPHPSVAAIQAHITITPSSYPTFPPNPVQVSKTNKQFKPVPFTDCKDKYNSEFNYRFRGCRDEEKFYFCMYNCGLFNRKCCVLDKELVLDYPQTQVGYYSVPHKFQTKSAAERPSCHTLNLCKSDQ